MRVVRLRIRFVLLHGALGQRLCYRGALPMRGAVLLRIVHAKRHTDCDHVAIEYGDVHAYADAVGDPDYDGDAKPHAAKLLDGQ